MYRLLRDGEFYTICKGNEPLYTPMGTRVTTDSEILAKRLVKHLTEHGESPSNPVSIVAFHYAMIDFFANMSRMETERSVAIGFDEENDWTMSCPSPDPEIMMKWWSVFGRPMSSEERDQAKGWLSSLTLNQLCAVCVIGRFAESVNIPYRLLTNTKVLNINKFAMEIVKFYPFVTSEELFQAFDNFVFYSTLDDNEEKEPKENSSQALIDRYLRNSAELYRACGPESAEYAYSLYKVAGLYLAQKDYKKAEPLYERALSLVERIRTEKETMSAILKDLAVLYENTGRIAEATETISRIAALVTVNKTRR